MSNGRPSSVLSTASRAVEKRSQLEGIMKSNCRENTPLIFLRENDEDEVGEYTDEQVNDILPYRDFKTRLFIANLAYQGNSAWVRNHHSDSIPSESNFTYIRDFFKASFAMKNHTAAKAILTSELTKWFDLSDDAYNTLATTLASALSEQAKNTSFQEHKAMVLSTDLKTLTHARRTLVVLLDILFSKRHVKRFLYTENNSNIYRLVHCVTKHRKDKWPLIYVTFSFLLQFALTMLVVSELIALILNNSFNSLVFNNNNQEDERSTLRVVFLYILASLGAIYSSLVASKEFRIAKDVRNFYGRQHTGPLQIIDYTVNMILPVVLIITGFFVIVNEEDFINAVLNTAAFLFIPEIDDQMPRLLGYDTEAMIENYLIAESKEQYDGLLGFGEEDISALFDHMTTKKNRMPIIGEKVRNDDRGGATSGSGDGDRRMARLKSMKEIDDEFQVSSGKRLGLEFNDYYITNEPERGSSPKDGILYTPYSINVNKRHGHSEIDPSNYITEDCLVQHVEWRYTTVYPNTTKPRVAYLKLIKLDGEVVEIREITHKKKDARSETQPHVLKGVYVVTNFVMSNSILKLRLCGSKSAKDFIWAMEYYSLWSLTRNATMLLRTYKKVEDKEGD
eukprot:CAMPEP_0203684868 /NCGR_PEP_ID=MMETSP0090-20130426/48255_1 /ASSEMBLY_ACC=CAM_ASM_001088 /TAXON_ID=426623 /ORGANISM="Chaetoceros affinis, Strain CCMP159" /LENGTH=620 /DNA_ID=CAMNT_0050554049 /DNA_START=75 /DNA_END=1937 /DNA_ORIENTATION=+